MTKLEQILHLLREGWSLRFCDYGSGNQRVCLVEAISPSGLEQLPFHVQSFYRLRKRGAIVMDRSAGAFDYYALPTGGHNA